MPACPRCGVDIPAGRAVLPRVWIARRSPGSAGAGGSRRVVTSCSPTWSARRRSASGSTRRCSAAVQMSRYFEPMRPVIERHGGTVEKFIGDAVMAVFGIPTLHEDDALRAVRAAPRPARRSGGPERELERERSVRIDLRVGVHTGEVVAAEESTARQTSSRATRSTPPPASSRRPVRARSSSASPRGGSSRTLRCRVGRRPIDAGARPSRSPRCVSSGSVASARRRPSAHLEAPIVGRDAELVDSGSLRTRDRTPAQPRTRDRHRDRPASARAGSSGVHRVVADRATILKGRCLPYGDGITYWPIGEILSAAGGHRRGRHARRLRGRQLDRARPGRPRMAVWSSRPGECHRAGHGVDVSGGRHPWAIRRTLEHLAPSGPLVARRRGHPLGRASAPRARRADRRTQSTRRLAGGVSDPPRAS